ncbi:MAG: rhomboid family intramembrane serine protease [Aristaeellaceae bacterium]
MRFNQWLDRMERKFGKYAISNLMMYIVSAMAVVFVLDMLMPVNLTGYLVFNKAAILRGQLWRLVTFLFLPPDSSIVWILFSLYFYWMIGSALENQWGSFRFNMYYLFGMLGTIVSGMITGYATNSYLNLSLFLGFALLYPDFQVNLFFFLPVRVKYLALIDALGLAVSFVMGNASSRIALVMALLNVLLFFGGNLIQRVKSAYRRYKWRKSFRD